MIASGYKIKSGQVNKPKVCQVLYAGLGGHGSVVFSLIGADHGEEWQHSLLFYGVEPLRDSYREICITKRIPFTYISKIKRIPDVISLIRVYRFFVKQRPDTILLHSPSLLPVAKLYSARNRCRVIVIEHNAVNLKSKSEWLLSAYAMKNANKVVYLSREYEDAIRARLKDKFVPSKATVIPNGIDTNFFHPPDYGLIKTSPPCIRLAMIARFTSARDQKTIITAVANLRQFSSLKICLALAGNGDTFDEVVAFAQNSGVENVAFPGMLSETEVAQLLRDTDIYVHSTLMETMSTSIMQALATGLPVLASDIPGVRNMINGSNGLLFKAGAPDELMQKILTLIEQPQQRKLLGQRARDFAVQHLSHLKMFEQYRQLI